MYLVAAIDDGGFSPDFKYLSKKPQIPLFLIYYRKPSLLGVKYCKIKIDGLDATKKVMDLLILNRPQILLSQGITVGGFNMVDFVEIKNKLGIPSIIVIDRKPDFSKIKEALIKHFKDAEIRLKIISKHPPFQKLGNIYYENIGIEKQEAEKIIKELQIFSKMPEPIRLAHLIAKAYYEYTKREAFSS